MDNDQANAENVLEVSLDLIRQILIKHESAAIATFRSCIEAKKHELQLIYAERDELLKALGNCYMMARRELRRPRGESPPSMQRERWEHIKRFCEETGLREQILRASFPTELTDGR